MKSTVLIIISIISFMTSSIKNTSRETSTFIIVWRYTVAPENKTKFEKEYGSEGTWALLFKRSEKYLGSVLYEEDAEENQYLLIDKWKSKEDYDSFKEDHKKEYEALSRDFEILYLTEVKVGEFSEVIRRSVP